MRNFTQGDKRNVERSREKSVCFLFYAMGKPSMHILANMFRVMFKILIASIYAWIRDIAGSIPESEVGQDIKEIEIDEMWYFFQKNQKL